jgi:hypothetical protein
VRLRRRQPEPARKNTGTRPLTRQGSDNERRDDAIRRLSPVVRVAASTPALCVDAPARCACGSLSTPPCAAPSTPTSPTGGAAIMRLRARCREGPLGRARQRRCRAAARDRGLLPVGTACGTSALLPVDTSDIIATVAAAFTGGSLVLAGWAATTAHKARVWQQKRDQERLATRIEVTMHGAHLYTEGGPLTQIMVTAINHGENTEYIDDVEIESAGPDPAGVRHIQPLPPGAPFDIAAAVPTAFDEIPVHRGVATGAAAAQQCRLRCALRPEGSRVAPRGADRQCSSCVRSHRDQRRAARHRPRCA